MEAKDSRSSLITLGVSFLSVVDPNPNPVYTFLQWQEWIGCCVEDKSLRTSHQYYQVCHIMLLIMPCAEVCSNEELHHFSYDQTFN